jgi:hypothetical protein
MKKILPLIIILFISNQINAQNNEDKYPRFKFGINAGPNYTRLRGNYDDISTDYEPRIDFSGGAVIEYQIHKNLSVLINLNYETKSFKSEYTTIVGSNGNYERADIDEKLRFESINIPILVRHYLGYDNMFFLNAGLFLSHITNVKNEMINTESGENYSYLDFNEIYGNNDFGLVFGFGTNIKLNSKNDVSIEFRDDYGLTNIFLIDGYKAQTNTMKLILTWSFNR